MEMPYAIQGTSDELVVGYTPAFRTTSGWRHTFRQARRARDGGVVRRVVFDNIDEPHRRVLVDVAEFPSDLEAGKKLDAAREDANFQVVDGAARFGPGSFGHPEGQARTLYFRRWNLMIWVYSCGRETVHVSSWAEQILNDLEAEQTAQPGSDLTLTAEHEPTTSAEPYQLSVTCRWDRGEWAWRKFKATGGTLARSKDDETLLFWPAAGSKEPSVTGWAIEPGRGTYAGRYTPARRSA